MVKLAVYAGIGLVIVALMLWQQGRRRRLARALVIEAPAASRGVIVSVLLAGVALVCAAYAVMMVTIPEWTGVLVSGGLAAGTTTVFWVTRRPLGVLRLDRAGKTLSFVERDASARFNLQEPFVLTTTLQTLPVPRMKGSAVVVSIAQGTAALTWWHPWTLRDYSFGTTPSVHTSALTLPPLRLDWRGALITEHLATLQPPTT